jgi:hypothetical protein
MTVGGGLLVNRAAKLQPFDDGRGAQVEVLLNEGENLRIGQLAGAKGVYGDVACPPILLV